MSEARTCGRPGSIVRTVPYDHGIGAGAGALPQLTVVANERPKNVGVLRQVILRCCCA